MLLKNTEGMEFMLFYVLLVLGIVSAVVFMAKRVKEGGVKALVLKALTSALFVSCASAAAAEVIGRNKFGFALFVIPGLVFGLMGDIWLDLKWVYPQDNDIYTFSGFGAFMIGHILFISGLIKNYADFKRPLYIILPLIIAAVIAVGIIILEKPMKMKYGKFKLITAVYACILAFMTLLSGSLALMNSFGVKTLNIMFAGGVFFLISDLILSGTYFGEGKNRPVDVITNHASYFAAQFLIAYSIMFV